jgi:hypothetical protein
MYSLAGYTSLMFRTQRGGSGMDMQAAIRQGAINGAIRNDFIHIFFFKTENTVNFLPLIHVAFAFL